ncbi:ornithine cyclodeaminase family protein [Pseudomonas trivialis]|uniref:Ornithine cyclodeaminase n=1 Tax=Pseudomonas trivialis TaxID=200450 RepID=A0A0R2ZH13_9PSED|nr:ornithine cyclodeaminase family protein [Pseudomonas trivialis]KRP60008.1 ornithine cyclodeaminase [Pseudomonas trivialis]SDS65261.1 ornithine cyclodeaminase [Pseudomonas trivialis]
MNIYTRAQIMTSLCPGDAAALIAQGFIAQAEGRVQLPPIQSLQFPASNGDCCVKSAWMSGDEVFSVRVSAGFYDNPAKGFSSNDGLTLIFSALTGQPVALLRDGGWLTSMRTALAGQIVARAMAPSQVSGIGVVGTGEQARMQLEQLMPVTACRRLTVYGRNRQRLKQYCEFAEALGFDVAATQNAKDVATHSNLIITATPSREAIIANEWVNPGTHITAIGADSPGKQELDAHLVARADVIVVDSIEQCCQFGEISGALKSGLIDKGRLLVLGSVLSGRAIGRRDDTQITVADLTGLGVQDAQIAKCAMASLAH